MAKLLLDHHCEVDPVDENGQTPLFKASLRGDVEMCQLLVRTMRLLLLFIFMRYSYIGTVRTEIKFTFEDRSTRVV